MLVHWVKVLNARFVDYLYLRNKIIQLNLKTHFIIEAFNKAKLNL